MSFVLQVGQAYDSDFPTVLRQQLAILESESPGDAEWLQQIAEELPFCTCLVRFIGGGIGHGFAMVHPKRRPNGAGTELKLDPNTYYVRYIFVVIGQRSRPGVLLRFLEDLVSHARQSQHRNICFDLPVTEQFQRIHPLLQDKFPDWCILRRSDPQEAIRYTVLLTDAAERLDALNR